MIRKKKGIIITILCEAPTKPISPIKLTIVSLIQSAAEEAGPIKSAAEAGSMKGEKAPDNYKELKGYGTDQTYLARKIMTEHPDTFGKLKAVCAVADLVRWQSAEILII